MLCKTALETLGILREDACYHAQQSVEKALKALLTAMNVAYPRTHSLDVLLHLLKSNGVIIPEDVDESFQLSQYAVQTRYPGDWQPVTQEEAEKACDQAKTVFDWVHVQLDKITRKIE